MEKQYECGTALNLKSDHSLFERCGTVRKSIEERVADGSSTLIANKRGEIHLSLVPDNDLEDKNLINCSTKEAKGMSKRNVHNLNLIEMHYDTPKSLDPAFLHPNFSPQTKKSLFQNSKISISHDEKFGLKLNTESQNVMNYKKSKQKVGVVIEQGLEQFENQSLVSQQSSTKTLSMFAKKKSPQIIHTRENHDGSHKKNTMKTSNELIQKSEHKPFISEKVIEKNNDTNDRELLRVGNNTNNTPRKISNTRQNSQDDVKKIRSLGIRISNRSVTTILLVFIASVLLLEALSLIH